MDDEKVTVLKRTEDGKLKSILIYNSANQQARLYFSDDEKSVVAGIFHKDDELDGGDGNKTINEVVKGILNASVSKRSASATSVEDVNRMLIEKQKLQRMIIEI